jgi:NTE family protein
LNLRASRQVTQGVRRLQRQPCIASRRAWDDTLHRGRVRRSCSRAGPVSGRCRSGLQALYAHEVVPDILVGTSAGALSAAFVASRAQTAATARTFGSVWRSLQREHIFPVSLGALVGGLSGRRDHLVPDRGLRRLIRRYLHFDDLADSPIPLHLVAFDLTEGSEVLLSEGPAVDSVVAAASIPDVFHPW